MLEKVVDQFRIEGEIATISPFGNGHIHQTYKVSTKDDDHPNYLIQQINHHVFKDVKGVMDNIKLVCGHLEKSFNQHKVDQETLVLVSTKKEQLIVKEDDHFWRGYIFKDHLNSFDLPESDDQIFEGAKAYGLFLKHLSDVPSSSLVITIPDFNNLRFRLRQFEESKKTKGSQDAEKEVSFVYEIAEKLLVINQLVEKNAITLRVTHNDTKFNNVLLDHNNKGKCVIDLDTVMPGVVHYDFGDGIRTSASTAAEDEVDLHKVELDMNHYRAFAEGYMEATADSLTTIEKQYLPLSGAYMAFIMGVRFLTDHLNGDVYYKTSFRGHNLNRCRCQFELTRKILAREKDLRVV